MGDESPNYETVRLCSCCQEFLPHSDYYAFSDGRLRTQCKGCYKARQGTKSEPSETPDALYVMSCSILPGVLKIGRSADPEARRKEMQASQPYFAELVATFPRKGHIEGLVHTTLSAYRHEAPGREWFEVTTHKALDAILLHL